MLSERGTFLYGQSRKGNNFMYQTLNPTQFQGLNHLDTIRIGSPSWKILLENPLYVIENLRQNENTSVDYVSSSVTF